MDKQVKYIGSPSDFLSVLQKFFQEKDVLLEISQNHRIEPKTKGNNLVFVAAPFASVVDTTLETRWVLTGSTMELAKIPANQAARYHHVIVTDIPETLLSRQLEGIVALTADLETQLAPLREELKHAQQHIQLYQEVLSKMQRISTLSRQINCLDLDRIGSICIEAIPQLISAKFASLYSFDHRNQVFHLLRHNHPYTIDRLILAAEHPRSPMVMAASRKQLQLIKNLAQWSPANNQSAARPFTRNYKSNSCIIAPLLSGNNVVGVLNLADKIDAEGFDEERDLPPIQLLCEIIGSAMTNIQLYEKVMHQARTDGVTGLLNHRAFYRELHREVLRQKRYGGDLSLIMIDLDGLKKVNDTYGHRAGDLAIRHVSQKIKMCLRQTDIAARYGGDEFAIILPSTQLADAMVVARRLVKLVSGKTLLYEGQELQISVSVGLAELTPEASLEELMNRADTALFEAKAAGKNRMQTFVEVEV